MRKFRVLVAMHPLVFNDFFEKKPDKEAVLEIVLDKLQRKELDEKFIVVVEEVKQGVSNEVLGIMNLEGEEGHAT